MLILSKVLYFFKIMKVGVLRSMASPNRVGSCLWKFICILIRGHKRKILLRESHCKFRNTLFCKAFFNYIKQYNMLIRSGKKEKDEVIELITHGQLELCTLPQITCQEIHPKCAPAAEEAGGEGAEEGGGQESPGFGGRGGARADGDGTSGTTRQSRRRVRTTRGAS